MSNAEFLIKRVNSPADYFVKLLFTAGDNASQALSLCWLD